MVTDSSVVAVSGSIPRLAPVVVLAVFLAACQSSPAAPPSGGGAAGGAASGPVVTSAASDGNVTRPDVNEASGGGPPISGTDSLRAQQWGLDAVRAEHAWTAATGSGVVIAVVDTGVDASHPDLVGRLVPGIDLVDPGATTMTDPNGHGTHVAGVAAAATGNGLGIAGSAPGAMIMPIRVLGAEGSGDDQVIAEGIEWAVANGADVINLSLGESGFVARLSKNGPLNAAVRRADAAGVVVVAAAGNDGATRQTYRVGVPVVVVNATAPDGSPASFSNNGDVRSVAAPGKGILSTAPLAPTTIWPQGSDGYETLDGTSMASPLVAAVAALLVEQGLAPGEIRDRLTATTVNAAADPALGAGIIDAAAAVGAAQ
jgi:subtilisin family serine protease